MGTENSSEETRKRASDLAEEIGSYHMGTFCIVVFLIILIVDGIFSFEIILLNWNKRDIILPWCDVFP